SKDLGIQLTEEGVIHHRLALPLSAERASGEALDGQLGTLLKLYREYRRCPDDKFLRKWWENAKRALQFVWRNHDPEGKGVIRDRQFNTYDDAVYELNSFIGSLYLAALRAMEEMALRMGDSATAEECRKRFELGSESVAAECWDGEYFMQPADLETIEGRNYGKGCLSDQVVGQWWAHILRLGHILPSEKVRVALESILKYNWMERMGDFKQNPRVYAGPEDSGLLCCTWPKGGRPKVPILYCDEAWTGIEYQVAGHLIFEGMAERGAEIVRKARRRSNGKLRPGTHPSGVGNPWNEIECGDHYARAMSSYALLLAAQGQDYEGPAGRIAFHPAIGGECHRSFFSAAEGWGSFEQVREGTAQREAVFVAWGRVEARELRFTLPTEARELTESRLLLSGNAIPCAVVLESNVARFALAKPLALAAGDRLLVEMAWRA
ncbi:MAG: hypothetical protein HUU16_17505, partial [Candidatus Omnitrophica bacterium]|nr:hypothetical protein [Candidatus Omnitrophota bacterium]